MSRTSLKTMLAALAGLALSFGAGSAVADSISYTLGVGNTIGLGPGPYAAVTVNLTSSTTADITFTANTNGGYAFVDGSAAGLNVNGGFSVSNIAYQLSSLSPQSIAPTPYTQGSGQVDGYGQFNLTLTQNDGWGAATKEITFTLTATGTNTWASASNVLSPNASGNYVVAHVGYCQQTSSTLTACASVPNGATGFATVPIPAAAWLFGSGLLGLVAIARRRGKASESPALAPALA